MNMLSVLVFGTLSTLLGKINCTKKELTTLTSGLRFRDVAQALSHAYKNLPAQMTIDEKCKRYAVLSSLAMTERVPSLITVSHVLKMDKDELIKQYDGMNIDRIIHAYMGAIDRFRITQLAPAFIDLIECLRVINTTVVNAYLNNQELVIILDLYKQVLGLPGTKIDVNSLDLTEFGRAFRNSLRNLFHDYFEIFNQSSPNIAGDHIGFRPQDQQSRQERYVSQ